MYCCWSFIVGCVVVGCVVDGCVVVGCVVVGCVVVGCFVVGCFVVGCVVVGCFVDGCVVVGCVVGGLYFFFIDFIQLQTKAEDGTRFCVVAVIVGLHCCWDCNVVEIVFLLL